jgi:hypothetical protein
VAIDSFVKQAMPPKGKHGSSITSIQRASEVKKAQLSPVQQQSTPKLSTLLNQDCIWLEECNLNEELQQRLLDEKELVTQMCSPVITPTTINVGVEGRLEQQIKNLQTRAYQQWIQQQATIARLEQELAEAKQQRTSVVEGTHQQQQ